MSDRSSDTTDGNSADGPFIQTQTVEGIRMGPLAKVVPAAEVKTWEPSWSGAAIWYQSRPQGYTMEQLLAMYRPQSSGAYLCRNCGSYVSWIGDAPSEAQPLCGQCVR